MRFPVIWFALAAAPLCGCASSVRNVPPPVSTSATIPRVGQIDDDRNSEVSENVFVTILMLPVRAVEGLIAIPAKQIQYLQGDTPVHAARMTTDQDSADNRREGIYKLADYSFAHRPPYTTRYEQMAETDSDPSVRAAALRACNIARDTHATQFFILALTDSSELVRLEAAKGLCNLPDPKAVPALLRAANNAEENRDVRIATVDALKYYRTPEVARGLASLLNDRDYGVAFQSHRSLIYMTHKDFGFDESTWLSYFAGPDKPLG